MNLCQFVLFDVCHFFIDNFFQQLLFESLFLRLIKTNPYGKYSVIFVLFLIFYVVTNYYWKIHL